MSYRPFSQIFLAVIVGLLSILALAGLLSSRPAIAENITLQEQIHPSVQIQDLAVDQEGLRFTLMTPAFSSGNEGQLSVAGLQERIINPEYPDLPYYTTLIVLPPGAEAKVTASTTDIGVSIQTGLQSSPRPQIAPYEPFDEFFAFGDIDLTDHGLEEQEANGRPLVENRFFPDEYFEISEPMYMRDLRLVRLKVFPLRYNNHTGQLAHTGRIDISVDFLGSDLTNRRPLPDPAGQAAAGLESQILNYDQVEAWRSLPVTLLTETIQLPLGQPVFKISVNRDGLYEVTAEQLSAAGMVVGPGGVNPHTFEMMYRGQPVSYEFIGNGDSRFDPGERIIFYGWAFDGSRLERQFINNNIFWLWAGGDPQIVASVASISGTEIVQVPDSVTEEEEISWFSGYTDRWEYFPNEPDAWFWRLFNTSTQPVTETFALTLEHPIVSGRPATVTAEFSSRTFLNHTASFVVNDLTTPDPLTWYGVQNTNVTQTIPVNNLHHGVNFIEIAASSTSSDCLACIALNRITVDYYRKLAAVDDQIIFSDKGVGPRQYSVGGFTTGQSADTIVWEITDRLNPRVVSSETITVTGSGAYTLTFGANSSTPPSFIATTKGNLLSPAGISTYEPPDLDPPSGGAEWVAIAFSDFITETQRLADHRSSSEFGGLVTHVVDNVDVINQYGYGLPIPAAIQTFLVHGLESWDLAPRYLLLVGDSTLDPRRHKDNWSDEQYVLTDLVFDDPWQGQIPSDHTFSLLVGPDKIPDIAVGRIAAKLEGQVTTIINKIILYEENHLLPSGWMENLVYVSDNEDLGGPFCRESVSTSTQLPESFEAYHLCLDDYIMDADLLRGDLMNLVNDAGTSILNYRGHGSLNSWAGNPIILSSQHHLSWTNKLRPIVILTGDCLDGNFAYPPIEGFGEQLIRNTDAVGDGVSAAAHWGSTGLGTSDNHSWLIDAFYHALFVNGQVAIGDAAKTAKVQYGLDPYTEKSLLSSFTLQGDPAMQLFRRSLSVEHSVVPQLARVGDLVTYTIETTNQGIYPSHTTVSHTLPPDFEFVSAKSSVSATYQLIGNTVIFDLQFGEELKNKGIPRNGIALITVKVEIQPEAPKGHSVAVASVSGSGLEAWPGDERSEASVWIIKQSAFLPYVAR